MSDTKSDLRVYQPVVERRTRVLSVRGVEYCINEWGNRDAPLLFFLHGWGDTGSTFQFVVDALASEWHVVAPDWRGFGRSAHNGQSYWFPDYLADLHEILDNYSADRPVNLVGHSMGGNVCSLYAGIMPKRVSALVNLEGFGLSDSDPADAPLRYRRWVQRMRTPPAFATYDEFSELAMRIRKRNPGIGDARAGFVARAWACEDGACVRLRADPRHKLPNPVLYRRREAEACWQKISARILLVAGARSPFAPQPGEMESLPFPGAETCTIEDAGHMLHFEAPERLAVEILRFFKYSL